jgi:glycine/D-amino acid oxidase-like deaminating enzyme
LNLELQAICDADQEDRQTQRWEGMVERDRVRRERVEELLATGVVQDGPDCFHAALVFQHGQTLDDFSRATELAKRATELGFERAR